jgi:hypothetical protein
MLNTSFLFNGACKIENIKINRQLLMNKLDSPNILDRALKHVLCLLAYHFSQFGAKPMPTSESNNAGFCKTKYVFNSNVSEQRV